MQQNATAPSAQRPREPLNEPPVTQLDLITALAVPLVVAALSTHYEWGESIFLVTRRWEAAQLDEWLLVALTLAFSLAWLSWRRSRQAVLQLRARRLAETELAAALAHNQRLAHENLRAIESERKTLAHELHDELGQYFNAIKLEASAIARDPLVQGTAAAAARRIIPSCDHVHAIVGAMIRRLRPVGLDELGLVAAVENCVDYWRRSQQLTKFELNASGNFAGLEELTSLTLFRLIQEGLTNCARHAGATLVEITLLRTPGAAGGRDELFVSVRDNGRGASADARHQGFGLLGMKERVTLMGGTLAIQSAIGKGFCVEATLPARGMP